MVFKRLGHVEKEIRAQLVNLQKENRCAYFKHEETMKTIRLRMKEALEKKETEDKKIKDLSKKIASLEVAFRKEVRKNDKLVTLRKKEAGMVACDREIRSGERALSQYQSAMTRLQKKMDAASKRLEKNRERKKRLKRSFDQSEQELSGELSRGSPRKRSRSPNNSAEV